MEAVTTEVLSSQGKYRFISCREAGYYRFNELEQVIATLRLILIFPRHLINHIITVKHGFHQTSNLWNSCLFISLFVEDWMEE